MMAPRNRFPSTVVAVLVALMLSGALASPAVAYPRPGRTEPVSGSPGGASRNDSRYPSVSADGRYVAFHSWAGDLVPGDTNGWSDVFVRDRETGAVERVSVATDGTEGTLGSTTGSSTASFISADGRYVAFYSGAWNLVPGDTNNNWDVFVHDRQTGVTELVSVAGDGTHGDFGSIHPSISADGRYVAFQSTASNLVPGVSNWNIFAHDRQTGTTEVVSVANDGTHANNASFIPAISAGGRHVAFMSLASNLVPGDTNASATGIPTGADNFVHDRETGITERVSVASDGTQANEDSYYPAISPDGRYVAVWSRASNLVPGDTNGAEDVFLHDRETGITERVSVGSDGAEANSASRFPSVSAGGRYVGFYSMATNLAPGDTNARADVFVHDRETRATERVSVAADGAQGNDGSYEVSISAEGRVVAFAGDATNLVPGDTNATDDVFVRDRGLPVGVGSLSAVPEGDRISVSGWATFSGGVVASAADPPGDGGAGAGPAGGELTGASLTYRPEQEDLLVRLGLTSLPSLNGAGGSPAVLYRLGFDLVGTRYEVRALRASATVVPPATPYFALYRCAPSCTEQVRLSGGIGGPTGKEVLVSVPLATLGAQEGAALTGIQAFTSLGEAASGALAALDQANLPNTTIPARQVSLGIAPAGTPEEQVVMDILATLAEGSFSGTLDAGSLSPGNHDVWARACLGETCGASSASFQVPA